MALSTFVGSFTVPTVTGNKATTGVGFAPKAMFFWGNRRATDAATGSNTNNQDQPYYFGMATVNASVVHQGVSPIGDDFVSTQVETITTACILDWNHTPTTNYQADFISMDADGFTVHFSTANATAYVINFLALGGSDMENAIVLSQTSPAGTGNQATTGAGFVPTAIIFVTGVTASSSLAASAFVGAASATTQRWMTAWDFSSTSNCYQRTVKVVGRWNGASIGAEADLVSFDADGFTLNWSTAATGSTILALCLRGGQYRAGTITQKTSSGTQATAGVGFKPTGLMFATFGYAAQSTVHTTAPSRQMVGAVSDTTHRAVVYLGDGSFGVTDLDRTKCYTIQSDAASPTTTAAADLNQAFDADGFTLNYTTADATSREILYLAFGSNNDVPPSPSLVMDPSNLFPGPPIWLGM